MKAKYIISLDISMSDTHTLSDIADALTQLDCANGYDWIKPYTMTANHTAAQKIIDYLFTNGISYKCEVKNNTVDPTPVDVINYINQQGTSAEAFDDCYLIEDCSPCGQDCIIEIPFEKISDGKSIITYLREFVESYDISYETSLWLDNTGHGKNGAPYDMMDIYEDMKWWRDNISDLVNELEKEFLL